MELITNPVMGNKNAYRVEQKVFSLSRVMTGASVKACFLFTYLTDILRNVGSRKIVLCVGCTFIKDVRKQFATSWMAER